MSEKKEGNKLDEQLLGLIKEFLKTANDGDTLGFSTEAQHFTIEAD